MQVRKRSFFGLLTLVGIGLLSGNSLFADYESLKYESLSIQDSDYEDGGIDYSQYPFQDFDSREFPIMFIVGIHPDANFTKEDQADKLQDDIFSYRTSEEVEAFIEHLNENKHQVEFGALDMGEEFFDRDVSNAQKKRVRASKIMLIHQTDNEDTIDNWIQYAHELLGISSNTQAKVLDESYYFDSKHFVHSGK